MVFTTKILRFLGLQDDAVSGVLDERLTLDEFEYHSPQSSSGSSRGNQEFENIDCFESLLSPLSKPGSSAQSEHSGVRPNEKNSSPCRSEISCSASTRDGSSRSTVSGSGSACSEADSSDEPGQEQDVITEGLDAPRDQWDHAFPDESVLAKGQEYLLTAQPLGDSTPFDAAQSNVRTLRSLKSILNKLTQQNFETLYEQLVAKFQWTQWQICSLLQEIVETTAVEHHFIPLYADLCLYLEADVRTELKVSPGFVRHRLFLLCKDCASRLTETVPETAVLCDETSIGLGKRKNLGFVKFIGELVSRGMLSSSFMLHFAWELIQCGRTSFVAFEFLATLLSIAAGTFDAPKSGVQPQLDLIFNRVTAVSGDTRLPTRIRFILRNLLDARSAGWPGLEKARNGFGLASPMLKTSRSSARTKIHHGKVMQCKVMQLTTTRDLPVRRGCIKDTAPVPTIPHHSPSLGAFSAEFASVASLKGVSAFDTFEFRRVVVSTLREIARGCVVTSGVARIRAQRVPREFQSTEFADILTRAAEEIRGPARRSAFAFAAGLCAAADNQCAFCRNACIEGALVFLNEVFEELVDEVPRLLSIVQSELLPTLTTVLPVSEIGFPKTAKKFWLAT